MNEPTMENATLGGSGFREFRTASGDTFRATDLTIAELLLLMADRNLAEFAAVLDRHILFAGSSFDVRNVYGLTAEQLAQVIDAVVRGKVDMPKDKYGETLAVSRDLHVTQSPSAVCWAAKVISVADDPEVAEFEVAVFLPGGGSRVQSRFLSTKDQGVEWHWPRSCPKAGSGG